MLNCKSKTVQLCINCKSENMVINAMVTMISIVNCVSLVYFFAQVMMMIIVLIPPLLCQIAPSPTPPSNRKHFLFSTFKYIDTNTNVF